MVIVCNSHEALLTVAACALRPVAAGQYVMTQGTMPCGLIGLRLSQGVNSSEQSSHWVAISTLGTNMTKEKTCG